MVDGPLVTLAQFHARVLVRYRGKTLVLDSTPPLSNAREFSNKTSESLNPRFAMLEQIDLAISELTALPIIRTQMKLMPPQDPSRLALQLAQILKAFLQGEKISNLIDQVNRLLGWSLNPELSEQEFLKELAAYLPRILKLYDDFLKSRQTSSHNQKAKSHHQNPFVVAQTKNLLSKLVSVLNELAPLARSHCLRSFLTEVAEVDSTAAAGDL